MSALIKSLQASLAATKPRTLGKGQKINMIGKVVDYKDKTIVVEAVNGLLTGQTVEIGLPSGNSKLKMENFTKPSKAQTSMYTEKGGLLRFDGVMKPEHGDALSCSWINSWIKTPSDDHKVLPDAQISVNMTDRTTSSGYPDWRVNTLEASQETKVGDLAELKETVTEFLKSHRGVLIVDTTTGFDCMQDYLRGQKTDDGYVFEDPEEHTEKLFAGMSEEAIVEFEGALAAGKVVVVPVSSIAIGGRTAEEVQGKLEEAAAAGKTPRIMSVNTEAYKIPSIGNRLVNAFKRTDREKKPLIPAEYAERLSTAFLDFAGEEAKEAFHKGGWNKVADIDIEKFFASRDIDLQKAPSTGWNMAAVHLQRFDGGDGFFVAKTHELQRYANPYPDLECTKELRQSFSNEMVQAVKQFMDAPEATKAAEVAAPAAAAAAEVEPEVAAAVEADKKALESSIDDLINDVL